MAEDSGNLHGQWVRDALSQYEGRLVRYATRITGDAERARDVVQEAFLSLCRQDRQSLDGRLAPWLYRVCRNRALDVRRKEQRMTSLTAEQQVEPASREPDQADRAEQDDTFRHVTQLIGALPASQQEVVRLKFQEGLSYREIGEITQLSTSNVGYLLHTALCKLREQLGPVAPT